jgi:3' exoribonuclease, RNase T-like
MKYFLDTEFIESGPGKPIDLISIGIVAEDGRELYAINSDCPLDEANEWVKANVLPHLSPRDPAVFAGTVNCSLVSIARRVRWFCDVQKYGKPEFWGYYADYDWVVFCQMFGSMIDLPKGWPMYCRDIKQRADELGNPTLPVQDSTEHNALFDARWIQAAWRFLRTQDTRNSLNTSTARTGLPASR